MRAILLILMALVMLAVHASAARAQDDGPRVYQLAPVGARNVTAFLVNKRGNELPEPGSVVPGADIDTDILVFRYAETFEVAGRPVTPFAILPFGDVRRTGAASSSGLGDIQLGGTVGLVGAPALSREAYAAYKPGFGVQLLGRIYLPTGAYDAAQPVNLGANRTTFQVGLPTVFATGRSYAAPGLTSLEVLPTVNFYTANQEPFGAGRSEKDPLFSVEAHLTHTLAPRLWVSADLLYRRGGETTTDGVADRNAMRGWSAGGTLAVPFVASTVLALTWQHVIERSDEGPDGWFFRTAVIAPF